MQNTDSRVRAKEGKYLTFQLGDVIYGFEILKVQEIIGLIAVTPIPGTPDFVRGVINLRGKVIPVIDLRRRFCASTVDDTEKTCIIVVQLVVGARTVVTGIIVDEVSEVLDIPTSALEEAPEFGSGVDTEYILGIGKMGERVILLLEIERVLGADVRIVAEIAGKQKETTAE